MTKFKATEAVEPLDYDMRPYDDAQGTVPEPSNSLVAEFYSKLGKTLEEALGEDRTADVDMTVPEEVGKLFMTLGAEDHEAMYEQLLDLYAKVCGGSPSRDTLAALPYRLRQAFYGAVQGWLRPEA